MQFSFWPGTGQPWADLVAVSRTVEQLGWDRVYVADHFMSNDVGASGGRLEAMAALAGLAALVPRVGLGTLVCGNTYRHPAVLVKQAVTADLISDGRVILGLGAGWQQNEHDKFGIDLPPVAERMDRFEEACAVVDLLRTQDRATFSGNHYHLDDAPNAPRPVGPLPLLVGGGGERRTLPIAARFAQEWNTWSTPEVFAHKSSVLDRRCEDIGRDPASIHRSTQALVELTVGGAATVPDGGAPRMPTVTGSPEQLVEVLAAYRDAGVDEFIVPDMNLGPGARRDETIAVLTEQVIPALR